MLEFFAQLPPWIFSLLSLGSRLFVLGFIFFSTNYRNGKHSPVWYILGFLSPLIVFFVFLSKRKTMTGIGMKQCPICHSNYPAEFVTCYKCNVTLPDYDEKRTSRNKALATLSCVLAIVFLVLSIASNIISSVASVNEIFSSTEEPGVYSRIAFEDESGNMVYYDKFGNSYSKETDVPFYTEDNKKYSYNTATMRLHSAEGDSMDYYDSYVDINGNLVSNKNDEIYMVYEEETDSDEVEYNEILGEDYSYELLPYYEEPYTDDDGNKYYPVAYVSWTKDGKLITSAEQIK
ncbi:MAG: hypothetical protein IJ262_08685 [Clostridia bacterium]|nr:hypothetical protein [Clostridia bacterium]